MEKQRITQEVAVEMAEAFSKGESIDSIASRYASKGYVNKFGNPVDHTSIPYAINYTAKGLVKLAGKKNGSVKSKTGVSRTVAFDMLRDFNGGMSQQAIADKYNALGFRNRIGGELSQVGICYILKHKTKGRRPHEFKNNLQLSFKEAPEPTHTQTNSEEEFVLDILTNKKLSKITKRKLINVLLED